MGLDAYNNDFFVFDPDTYTLRQNMCKKNPKTNKKMIKDKRELCKQSLHGKCKGKNTQYEQVYEESGAGCRRRFTPSERKCSGGAEPIRWTTAEIHNDLLKQTKKKDSRCANSNNRLCFCHVIL